MDMKPNSKLASAIQAGGFIVTAEYLPPAAADSATIKAGAEVLGNSLTAVSIADNHSGIGMSSIAASSVFLQLGREPIYQIVTRDRNRIAIQSDLLGASALGIKNILCTSGHHQTLTGCCDSANVYDLDAIQVVSVAKQMRDKGTLLDGTAIAGKFSVLIGTVTNPYLRPLELNMIQLAKKIEAGADFVLTQPVFDLDEFGVWLSAAKKEGLTDKTAILAGVLPLTSAEEAEKLRTDHTELRIPDAMVARLVGAGPRACPNDRGQPQGVAPTAAGPDAERRSGADAQEREGLKICAEIIGKLKGAKGVRGVHILSGGREKLVSKLRAAASL
jgi:methylenetetrahydrofolate reductase (NADPH)